MSSARSLHGPFRGGSAAALLALVAVGVLLGAAAFGTPSHASADAGGARYLVTFAAGTSDATAQAALHDAGATVTSRVSALRLYAVTMAPDAAGGVAARSDVVRVEADLPRDSAAAPDDPQYGMQWALPRIGWDDVFGTVTPSASATVAVLDTGVDAAEPELAGKLVAGISILDGSAGTADPNGHGTAMAGIVAAATNNGGGIAGVGYDGVNVMPVTVLDAGGTGNDSDIIEGVVYAADHGADVILMAFSNPGFSASLQAAIDYAWDHGAVLVAATGNDASSVPTFPAADRSVIGVASTSMSDTLSATSNYGAGTFLAAPGEGIASVDGLVTGTSASAAIVAGSAALLKAVSPSATNGLIAGRLARTADPAGSTAQTGNGRVNLARAVSDTSTDYVRPAGAADGAGPIVGPYVAAAPVNGVLQSQNKTPCASPSPCPWQTANPTGWAELDTAPVRLYLEANQGSDTPTEFDISIDHASGVTQGLESLKFVSKTSNVSMSAITLTKSTNGAGLETWTYTFTVDMTDDLEGEIRFSTRLLAGSHNFNGASLQIKGAGTVSFPKPSAQPGNPDLSLTKSGSTTVAPGQTMTYTLTYRNLASGGANNATGVQLTDTLPPQVTYVDGSCTGCAYDSLAKTLSWDIGTVVAGAAPATRTYQVVVGSGLANGATFRNAAEIFSSQNETVLTNNASSVTTTVVVTAITGSVRDDLNGNAVNDSEPPLAGATLRLYLDTNSSGSFDGGDVQVAGSPTIVTDATGDWTFPIASLGTNRTYFVVRTNPPDYESTAALPGSGVNTTTTAPSSDVIKVVFAPVVTTGRSTNNTFLAQLANQAPTADAQTVTTNEDTAKLVTLTGSDPDGDPLTYTITSLPALGKLYKGNSTAPADEITVPGTTLSGATVTYVPVANASGSPYTTFQFRVSDGSLDSSPATVTVNVDAVNDPPDGTNNTVTVAEDGVHTFTAAQFGFSDPDGHAFAAVTITTIQGGGTLTAGGLPVNPGDEIAISTINAGGLKFAPAANASGDDYASFDFKVRDGGGTANGGIDTDPTANTMTIDVSSVNDRPAGTDGSVSTLEDQPYTFTTLDFGFTDPDDTPANTLLAVRITALETAGALQLDGADVTLDQEVSATDIANGKLTFAPAANANGTPYATFAFNVRDNGGGSDLDASANTMTVNVTPVNDAPTGTDNTVGVSEDATYTFAGADFGFADPVDAPDDDALLTVRITTLPGAGSLTLNGGAVSGGQQISATDIADGKLRFSPAANANGAPYTSFTFQVRDDGGTANAGVDLDPNPNTMTINVAAVHDPPAGADTTLTILEDEIYTLKVADFGFSDADDTPSDAFASIVVTATQTAGALELNGAGVTPNQEISVADVLAGKLKFTPALNAWGSPYSSFDFKVRDAGAGANLDPEANTLAFDVTSVNDAPAGADSTVLVLEDGELVFAASQFGFSDASDAPDALLGVVITTTPASGALTLDNVAVTGGQEVSAADIVAGRLRFVPAANAFGNGYASFSFQVRDNGGTADGGVDTDPTANTMTVDVTPVNDAPAGADKTVAMLEDTTLTFLVADFGFSDPTDAPSPDDLAGVVVATLPAHGTLKRDGVAVSAGEEISAVEIADGKLTFAAAANANGTPYASFTFRVRDDGGMANGGVDTDASANTMTINVTSVNDAPQGASKTVTVLEDDAYDFAAADFGFSDPNDVPPNAFAAVRISALETAGALRLGGVDVTLNQQIAFGDIGELAFTPAANANGNAYATFKFRVLDNGGTANGGVDIDPVERTITVNVTSVNDAPDGADRTMTMLEDTTHTFATSEFGFTDVNDAPSPNVLAGVVVTTLPANGALKLNNVAVTAGQEVSAADIAAGRLTFAPAANANGTPYASFQFKVRDDGGTANGGIDVDANARTMTINVTPVNDAPSAVDASPSVLEDGSVAITLNGSDLETSDANLRVSIVSGPSNGTLTKGGLPVSDYDGTGASVLYTPVANFFGSDSFTFSVTDTGDPIGCGAASATCAAKKTAQATVSIAVTPVNDPPAGANKTVSTNEDTAYTFTAGDFGFSDTTDAPSPNALKWVTITTLPTDGTLKLGATTVSAGQEVLAADITAGNLKFVPDQDEFGPGYATFTFQVRDDGGTANGGVDLDQSPNTLTIDVTAVNDAPVVTLSAANITGQYSDPISPVTVTATDVDTSGSALTLSAATLPNGLSLAPNAGSTGAATPSSPGTRTATISGRLNVPCAGTQPAGHAPCAAAYEATITATDLQPSSGSKKLYVTVVREDVTMSDITPYASMIEGNDGDVDSLNVQLVVDEAGDGNLSGDLTGGGLANAKAIGVSLTPVATGSSYACSATNTAYVSGQPARATASCVVADVKPNVYDTIATVGQNATPTPVSQYFAGSGQGPVTVMDPALGFTTGGGFFNTADGKVTFGFNAKILKSGQVQGSVLTIFKRANGNYVVKSNSMGALAVAKVLNQTYYGATIDGKATYAVPATDPALAPFCPGVWKCGGYTFRVYVEDLKEPGAGFDRFWIQVKDPAGTIVEKASMPVAAAANAKTIVGGNIQVPQPSGR